MRARRPAADNAAPVAPAAPPERTNAAGQRPIDLAHAAAAIAAHLDAIEAHAQALVDIDAEEPRAAQRLEHLSLTLCALAEKARRDAHAIEAQAARRRA